MNHYQCTACGDKIHNGEGHIRTENFRQVAWCEFCWLVRVGNALIASWAA